MSWSVWLVDGVKDIKDVKEGVIPPNEEPHGFDDRISFMDALCLAVNFRDEHASPSLLEALKKLYPKDVADSIGTAEESVRSPSKEFALA